MRRFTGLELGGDAIPVETTVLNFRNLLEKFNLASEVFESVNAYLGEQGLLPSGDSIVGAINNHAPFSTKNQGRESDSEMNLIKKGNTWYPSATGKPGINDWPRTHHRCFR